MRNYNNPLHRDLAELIGVEVNIVESQKSKSKKEQLLFCEIVENWDNSWDRSQRLYEDSGIDLGDYDSTYYKMIENLFFLHYGEKAEVIFWWIYERYTENGGIAILITEDGKEYSLKTPLQLYKFIKKLK